MADASRNAPIGSHAAASASGCRAPMSGLRWQDPLADTLAALHTPPAVMRVHMPPPGHVALPDRAAARGHPQSEQVISPARSLAFSTI